MSRRVVIDPVTRIEGRARVTIELDDEGRVRDAHVHATELRGFEVICVGRVLREMPALTSRICGICPVAHAVAAAKAGDVILGADPPRAARLLRLVVQLAQWIQSHALSFFYLTSPDAVLGDAVDPARRSFLGVAAAAPHLMSDGIALRRFGQEVIEGITGQRVHPTFAVPGGVARPLAVAVRDRILAALPSALVAAERAMAWWSGVASRSDAERSDERLETPFLALVGATGEIEPTDGRLRLVSASGDLLADGVDPARYEELVAEMVVPWSHAKPGYLRALGAAAGGYRVGPLARLNAVSRWGTPRADTAAHALRALGGRPLPSTFDAHAARLVEIVHALERIQQLLVDRDILDEDVLAPAGERRSHGVGACEAPRGTLFHAYRVDEDGLVTWVDLVTPTSQNVLAMDRTIRVVAERWLASDGRIDPALANHVQAAVRAFDPCLSCATHALDGGWAAIRVAGPGGELLDVWPRSSGSPWGSR